MKALMVIVKLVGPPEQVILPGLPSRLSCSTLPPAAVSMVAWRRSLALEGPAVPRPELS
jgi:hypothetical protein